MSFEWVHPCSEVRPLSDNIVCPGDRTARKLTYQVCGSVVFYSLLEYFKLGYSSFKIEMGRKDFIHQM